MTLDVAWLVTLSQGLWARGQVDQMTALTASSVHSARCHYRIQPLSTSICGYPTVLSSHCPRCSRLTNLGRTSLLVVAKAGLSSPGQQRGEEGRLGCEKKVDWLCKFSKIKLPSFRPFLSRLPAFFSPPIVHIHSVSAKPCNR